VPPLPALAFQQDLNLNYHPSLLAVFAATRLSLAALNRIPLIKITGKQYFSASPVPAVADEPFFIQSVHDGNGSLFYLPSA
jgi:hypothetical protein